MCLLKLTSFSDTTEVADALSIRNDRNEFQIKSIEILNQTVHNVKVNEYLNKLYTSHSSLGLRGVGDSVVSFDSQNNTTHFDRIHSIRSRCNKTIASCGDVQTNSKFNSIQNKKQAKNKQNES